MIYDACVIGGGMVGSAIAYGLAKAGLTVALVDEGDVAHRAARGNFGLVWVQGKGVDAPEYAAWTRQSADLWPTLAATLRESTGVDVAHQREGGVHFCFSDDEFEERRQQLHRLHNHAGIEWRYQMLDRAELAGTFKGLGPQVVGGSYSPADGHANPLYLLRGLHAGFTNHHGHYLPHSQVTGIRPVNGVFQVAGVNGPNTLSAHKLVLAAGLGNAKLGPQVGLSIPVKPIRGQVLVGEKLAPFMPMPSTFLRQTAEGVVLMGDSHEDVGFDEGTTPDVMADIARRALATFPHLKAMQITRTWGALRVMSADGLPIYDQSATCPGAFSASTHSGVTLAAGHTGPLASAIVKGELPTDFGAFSAERFADVPVH
ncbi:MAG: NAD(P)/FAD-dependent oxidoreductase [Candidatus Competibacterales bacterium]